MPRPNRVAPTGEFLAVSARGMLMGNRGVLHDAEGSLGAARWRHRAWVACLTAFKGRRRAVMTPGRYTELFFLDEATALAAGHRPCADCRRADHHRFRDCWARAHGTAPSSAAALDAVLHAARAQPGGRTLRRWRGALDEMPDGAFVALDGAALLVRGARLLPWRPDGYGPGLARPRGATVEVLTPAPTVATIAAGYAPAIHPSAGD